MGNDAKTVEWLRQMEEQVCREKGLSVVTFRRLLAVVEKYGDRPRAAGVLEELFQILEEDVAQQKAGD